MKLSPWEQVGDCPVDAGCLMLIDPCYTIDKTTEEWYDSQIVERCYENGDVHGVKIEGHLIESSGVVVMSGYGDGLYPVYVRRTSEGCIAEVKVVFIEEEGIVGKAF